MWTPRVIIVPMVMPIIIAIITSFFMIVSTGTVATVNPIVNELQEGYNEPTLAVNFFGGALYGYYVFGSLSF